MMKQNIFLLFLIVFTFGGFSQSKYTISGSIEDVSNGEKLLGANIYNSENYQGTASNNYGFYSLTQQAGKVNLAVSMVGYHMIKLSFNLTKDTVINFSLKSTIELDEVIVTGTSVQEKVQSSQMSVTEIPIKIVRKLPVLMGELDIIKTIQLLPGVQSGSEGSSGLYVRGGGPDQNLILLDGVPVYNVNHLFGFFSVFNTDAINSVKLTKGGFPARYGGRLSSVLDIRMKEGNNKKFSGKGSVGLISSKLTLEGPIVNENTSFIVSGRRTYIDLLAFPIIKAIGKMEDANMGTGYFFYDLNAKINHKFSDKSRLFLSAYMGNDKAYMNFKQEGDDYFDQEEFKLRWGNITSVLRWNYIINNKLFANLRGSYSQYNFLTGIHYISEWDNYRDEFNFTYDSGIQDYAVTADFDYMPSPNHYIRFGLSETYHTFNPGVTAFSVQESEGFEYDTTFGNRNIYAHEMEAYVEDDVNLGELLKINLGVHFSGFQVKKRLYTSVQPRISVRYLASEKLAIKASYAEMTQYLHLLSNSMVGLPTDLWVPVTDSIEPLKSRQYAIGGVYNFKNEYEFSIEGFYKKMSNLIGYKEGSSYLANNQEWTGLVTTGQGWAYGVELLAKKNIGKLSGWVGYTLSWSNRQFDEISFGEIFPYRYDRRHDIGIAITMEVMKESDLGLTWVYGTGNAVTLPTQMYLSDDLGSSYFGPQYIEYFESRNNYRMPAYHRLDFGMNFHKETKWGRRTWSFGAYNFYNRQNPFFLYFDQEYNYDSNGIGGQTTSKKVLNQVSLFPVLPYVSFSFEF